MRTLLIWLTLVSAPAAQAALDQPEIDAFIDQVVGSHGLDREWVSDIMATASLQQSILDAISRPAERVRPWHEYRALFINDRRIGDGVEFWQEHRDTLEQIAADCGVPAEIIVAILGIETHYGQRAGGYRVIDALSTLAFAYPPRAAFFRGELEQFLLLTREQAVDPYEALGSYAGAMGAAQFISSSYRRYAVDASGDGRVDLWGDWRDVIASVANYLHTFGWRPDEPLVERIDVSPATAYRFTTEKLLLPHSLGDLRAAGIGVGRGLPDDRPVMLFELDTTTGPEFWVGYENFYVITRYNRSRLYAMAVRDLGASIAARVTTP